MNSKTNKIKTSPIKELRKLGGTWEAKLENFGSYVYYGEMFGRKLEVREYAYLTEFEDSYETYWHVYDRDTQKYLGRSITPSWAVRNALSLFDKEFWDDLMDSIERGSATQERYFNLDKEEDGH